MKRQLFISILIWFLALCVGTARAQNPPSGRLEDLVAEALANNPEVAAARARWQAERAKIPQAGGLPDPRASIGGFGDHIQTRTGPQERRYGFSQMVPFPGKLALKAGAQAQAAESARQRYEAAARETVRVVKFLYYDLYQTDEIIRITEEEKLILENLERVARRKYEADLAPQQDAVKAQLELGMIEQKLAVLTQQRDSLRARMNSVLDRPPGSPFDAVTTLPPDAFSLAIDELAAMADEFRPELAAARASVEKAELEKKLARMDYLPDFTLGVEYIEIGDGTTTRPDDGEDVWMGSVSVNVPLWFGRLDARVKEKNAQREAALRSLDALANTVDFEVQDAYFKVTSNREIVELYETALVPQAEQAFETARLAYEADRVDFLDWLDAERRLLQTKSAYYKAVADLHKSLAAAERIIGRDLP